MQKIITFQLLPSEAASPGIIQQYAAQASGISADAITGHHILRQSIDARGKQPLVRLIVQVFINEPPQPRAIEPLHLQNVASAPRRVIIVGAGPAGLFAALKLIESGIRPILLERGRDVKARRRDLALLNREGIVNPESNYCFGEGGAGTYSDGKLYTRSSKRGNITRILHILARFGADERILYESHPHIGTNKLPQIITAIREQIIACGGEVHFEKKLTDLVVSDHIIKEVITDKGERLTADAVILATGHSARDIFTLLHERHIEVRFKPFALGVRIEHPQGLIDSIQYHAANRGGYLPPASYSLVQQVNERGVFSFCMCPGGIIAPAATQPGEVVVNGWSPSKRNNPFANSGIVVSVEEEHIAHLQKKYGPLAGLHFQQQTEQKAYTSGGGLLVAPAQRMADFVQKKSSSTLPDCSYLPGIHSAMLHEVLPPFIYAALQKGFVEFGKKMKGYYTNDAVVVATESRTSSPVRIPRHAELLHHPQLANLYPCGEGAGYAGGIVSAAMDGERVAEKIALRL